MKKILLLLMAISVIACDIQPYNGKKAIFASIESSKKEQQEIGDEVDDLIEDGFADIEKLTKKMQELTKNTDYYIPAIGVNAFIESVCPVLYSEEINVIEMLGEHGIDAKVSLQIAFEEAEEVDFSNKRKVDDAIENIETAWRVLQPILYSVRLKVKLLFTECTGRIKGIADDLEKLEESE